MGWDRFFNYDSEKNHGYKLEVTPWMFNIPLPTISFQGRAVKLPWCISHTPSLCMCSFQVCVETCPTMLNGCLTDLEVNRKELYRCLSSYRLTLVICCILGIMLPSYIGIYKLNMMISMNQFRSSWHVTSGFVSHCLIGVQHQWQRSSGCSLYSPSKNDVQYKLGFRMRTPSKQQNSNRHHQDDYTPVI